MSGDQIKVPEVYLLTDIEGGSVLWSDGKCSVHGIKYVTGAPIPSVPHVDPCIPSVESLPVGLGTALLEGRPVYVALPTDPETTARGGMDHDIPNGFHALSIGKVTRPVESDPSELVDVYVLFRDSMLPRPEHDDDPEDSGLWLSYEDDE